MFTNEFIAPQHAPSRTGSNLPLLGNTLSLVGGEGRNRPINRFYPRHLCRFYGAFQQSSLPLPTPLQPLVVVRFGVRSHPTLPFDSDPLLVVLIRITIDHMATITLRIPDSLNEALDRQSEAQSISKSDLAREALRRFLAVAEFKATRAKLVPLAEAQGVHTDEDVFERLNR